MHLAEANLNPFNLKLTKYACSNFWSLMKKKKKGKIVASVYKLVDQGNGMEKHLIK